MVLKLEEGPNDAECSVDEDPRLRHNEEKVVELQLARGVVPQGTDLAHSQHHCQGRQNVEGQLSERGHSDGRALEDGVRIGDQDKEDDEGDDGDDHDKDAGEEAGVGMGAVHGVVHGGLFVLTETAGEVEALL